MEDGNTYYQLKDVSEMGNFIKTKVLARKKGKRNLNNIDWENLLYSTLETNDFRTIQLMNLNKRHVMKKQ